MKRIHIFIVLMLGTLATYAYDFEADGIYYNITSEEDKTVEVTKGDIMYSGDVVVPKTVTNSGIKRTVTSIGGEAFRDCSALKSIELPEKLTLINWGAFMSCDSLAIITINSPTPPTIGSYAFLFCDNIYAVYVPIEAIEAYKADDYWSAFYIADISNKAEEFAAKFQVDGIYYHVTSLENRTVEVISGDKEYEYSGDIVIPETVTQSGVEYTVTKIETRTFHYCSSLKSVEIPAAVIGVQAFYGCTALTNVVLKSSVTYIGYEAFSSCYSLESIDIPASVSYIGSGVFSGCWAMEEINVADDNMYYSSIDGVLYDKDKRTLMCYPGGLEGKFEIPNTVEKIGAWAFYQSAVSDIKIPASVATIDLCAFYGSGLLTSVELPASVTMIDNLAFYHCESLETVKCNNPTPPTISYGTFDQSPIEVFYVPDGSVTAYKEADIWKDYNIQGYQNPSDIAPISGVNDIIIANDLGEIPNGKAAISCYTLQGVRVQGVHTIDDVRSLSPGVYICRQGNKATKVVVK